MPLRHPPNVGHLLSNLKLNTSHLHQLLLQFVILIGKLVQLLSLKTALAIQLSELSIECVRVFVGPIIFLAHHGYVVFQLLDFGLILQS